MTDNDAPLGPKATAAVTLIGHTGAVNFGLRYQDDMPPTVWVAVATYPGDRHEAAGAMTPDLAVLRLAETLIDGGQCNHCRRPTSFSADFQVGPLLGAMTCCYAWDPELGVFRRGCEGVKP